MKIDFIQQIIEEIEISFQNERLLEKPGSWEVYSLISIACMLLCEVLDSIQPESITTTADADKLHSCLLPKIAEILEKFHSTSIYWYSTLFSWWRLEKKKRLFISGETEIFTETITKKLRQNNAGLCKLSNLKLQLEMAHWAVVTGIQLEKTIHEYNNFMIQAIPKFDQDSVTCITSNKYAELFLDIADDANMLEPNQFHRVVILLLNSDPVVQKLGMQIAENNRDILSNLVLSAETKSIRLPLMSFLPENNLEEIVNHVVSNPDDPHYFTRLHELLFSAQKQEVIHGFGKKFYKKLKKCTSEVKLHTISEMAVQNLFQRYPERLKSELEKLEDLPTHLIHSWLIVLSDIIGGNVTFDENLNSLAMTTAFKIVNKSEDKFDIQTSQAIMILYALKFDHNISIESTEISYLKSLAKKYKTYFEFVEAGFEEMSPEDMQIHTESLTTVLKIIDDKSFSAGFLGRKTCDALVNAVWPTLDSARALQRIKMIQSLTGVDSNVRIIVCELFFIISFSMILHLKYSSLSIVSRNSIEKLTKKRRIRTNS